MPKAPRPTKPTSCRSYADLVHTREECLSILECRGSDIRHMPEHLLDARLVSIALRNGAIAADLPASFR